VNAPGSADEPRECALGGIVLESAYMEHLLRAVFTALVGSKYAAVEAAGQNAGWLIERCEAITKVRQEISGDGRQAILAALGTCSATYQRRNRVVHDAWARRAGGRAVTLLSQRKDSDVTVTVRTVPELETLVDDLGSAAGALAASLAAAFGDDCLQLEKQLRLELGHDIGADAGDS
jgi:hypothetical protein